MNCRMSAASGPGPPLSADSVGSHLERLPESIWRRHERNQSRVGEALPELNLMIVDCLSVALEPGTTIGRFPFDKATIVEPTPAWVTTSRALRTCSTSSSKGRKSTVSESGPTPPTRPLDDQGFRGLGMPPRAPGGRTEPRSSNLRRSRGRREDAAHEPHSRIDLGELRPLCVPPLRHGRYHPAAQERSLILVRLST